MAEPEAVAGLGQHACGARLVHRRDQVGDAAAQHDRQIPHRELDAEQGGRPQHLAYRPGHEAQAVRDGRRQRPGHGTARQLRGTRVGDGQAGAAGQRGDELGDVERVPRGPLGQPEQAALGLAAGQRRHELGHRRLGQPGERQPGRIGRHPAQRQQVLALRHRACHPDQQQRRLHRPGQPSPQPDRGLVGPLQVIDDQDRRLHRALLSDERQQLLGQCRRHVGAAVRADLPAQQPHDRGPPGIRGGLAHPQPLQQRHQRQRLPQLVAGAPEHLAACLRRVGHRRAHQRRLADTRLALDEHRAAPALGHLPDQPGQQRHLAVAADQHSGRGYRGHGANFTTRIFEQQVGVLRIYVRAATTRSACVAATMFASRAVQVSWLLAGHQVKTFSRIGQ